VRMYIRQCYCWFMW